MAICEMHWRSQSLQKLNSTTIIIPEGQEGPWPVLYLLHGMSDDNTAWGRRTSIERYVDSLPMMVVMPSGGRQWYTDAVSLKNSNYESFITEDLISFIDSTFPTIASREGRVIAGLSMGGYGAFKIALHRPELFCAAVSHSGAVDFGSKTFTDNPEDNRHEFFPIFGPDPRGSANDVYALAANLAPDKLPALRFDCGVDDFLIEENRALHKHWEETGVKHEYAEHPGAHDWAYWDKHIQDTLAFFRPILFESLYPKFAG